MTETIGVRELKNQASRILRNVREDMAEYVVTLHGEPIAILRPLDDEELHNLERVKINESLNRMNALAQQVAAAWTSPHSGVEQIAEQRR
jgi:prevent-host-death family protein